MALTAEEYKELKALVGAPDTGLSDEDWNAAKQVVDEYEATYMQGWAEAGPDKFAGREPTPELGITGIYAPDDGAGGASALDPATLQARADGVGVREQVDKARAISPAPAPEPPVDLSLNLNPEFDLLPQALAIQPASTHSGGDKAAATEWMVSGGENAKGTVFAYEPPLAVVRKRFLEDPAFTRALYPHVPPNPEDIASIDNGSEMYKRAADYMWRETADAAAKGGKTAYRYSKAPWLHGGSALSAIESMGMKALGSVKPAAEGINAFVMGVDDTAAFGAMRAAQETANPEVQEPNSLLGIDSVGGIPTSDARQHNAATVEENPVMHTLGQGLGALAPWGAANRLFNFVAKGGAKAAGTGGGLVARGLASTGTGAIAGGAVGAAQEGVDAAASMAQTGEPGTTLEDAGERALDAGIMGGALGGGLEVLGSGAKAGADWIRHGRRYGGAPGKLERAGVSFGAMGPKLSPETKALIRRAQEADAQPGDLLAKEIAPKIKEVADVEVKAAIEQVTQRKQSYFATAEGKKRMPAQNLVNRSVEILRRKHDRVPGGKVQTLDVSGTTPKVKRIFNNEIGKISLDPSDGAIELSLDEAEEFLSPTWRRKAMGLRRVEGPKAPPGGPASPFAPSADLPREPAIEAHRTVAVKGDYSPPPEVPGTKQGIGPVRYPSVMDGHMPPARQSSGGVAEPPLIELTTAEKKVMGRLGNTRDATNTADPAVKAALDKTRVESPPALYKGMTMHEDELQAMIKKGELPFENFSSTATDKTYATGYAATGSKGSSVLLEFDGIPAAHRKSDREMLIPPGGYRISGTRKETIRIPELDRDVETTVVTLSSGGGKKAAAGDARLGETLRRQGVDKVYVIPRRHDARSHEEVLHGLKGFRTPGAGNSSRELQELDQAARLDRDARPMDGKPGGWSALQAENAQLLGAQKSLEKLVSPKGEPFKVLAGHGKSKPGELLTAEALRKAADKGGVRDQLEQIRHMDPLLKLRDTANWGVRPGLERGLTGKAFDAGAIRAFPVLRSLEGQMGPIRGGMGGRGALINDDERPKEEQR